MANLGGSARGRWDELRHAAAVIGTVLGTGFRPRYWARPVRTAFSRQVLAIGVEPLLVCRRLGGVRRHFGGGAAYFLDRRGGAVATAGPLLVTVVARELGPVLINLVVIVRSGSAMTTELGVLKINGEVRALEAQGGDPFLQLVMPRVLGMAVSTFCLTIVFILVAFASGYLFAAWTGNGSRDLFLFADTVSRSGSAQGRVQHPRQKHPARPVCQRVLLHWRAGRRRIGHGNPAGHATGAHPLRRRTICHLRRGIAADLPLTMNKTSDILDSEATAKNQMEERFKFRRVNEITGVFVLVIVALLIAAVLWTGHSQRWFKSRVTLRIVLPEAGAAGIRQGSEVYFLGTLVGSVSDVDVDPTGRMEAEANIRRDFFRFVRADSSAVVKKKFGVAGDSFFEITRGTGQPLPEDECRHRLQ